MVDIFRALEKFQTQHRYLLVSVVGSMTYKDGYQDQQQKEEDVFNMNRLLQKWWSEGLCTVQAIYTQLTGTRQS